MRGRRVHENKTQINKDYLRKSIGATDKLQEQYLTNDLLRGKVDEVLTLDDGTMAPLDYKFAQYKDKIFSTYKTQLACYACLIEDNFGKKVNRGFLVYTRNKNKLIEIPITDQEKEAVKECALAIGEIISENWFPKATKYKKKCVDCTYRNICIQ